MSALATETIALRAFLLFVIGVLALAGLSGYTARPSRSGPVSGWIAVPILAAKICLLLGPAGLALIVGRTTGQLNESVTLVLVCAAVIFSYWLSSIAVQAAQNIAYRMVGARTQKIRWFAWSKPRSRRAAVTIRE